MMSHDGTGCRDAIERLDDYLDRELGQAELKEIEGHLDECPPCAKAFGFEGSVIEQIRQRVAEVDVPGDLKSRVLARLAKLEDCD